MVVYSEGEVKSVDPKLQKVMDESRARSAAMLMRNNFSGGQATFNFGEQAKLGIADGLIVVELIEARTGQPLIEEEIRDAVHATIGHIALQI